MSILDGKVFFADDVSVPASGGLIGDVIDTYASHLNSQFWHGEPTWWVNLVTKQPTSQNSSATFVLNSHDTEDVYSGYAIVRSGNYTMAGLTEGMYYNIIMPLSNAPVSRYIGAALNVTGSAGMRVTSYLTTTPPSFGWEKIKDWRP